MQSISKTQIVPYSSEEMYNLVNAVETYPEFLSWCSQSVVHHRTEDELKATLVMSAGGFTQSITTHNRMQKDKMIEVRLVEGPLKHLESFWRFENIDTPDTTSNPIQCHIFFDIEFEFSNLFMRMTLEPFFSKVADTLMENFCARAEALYKR
jgi:ribosome-associated toxin RatA of RatAB toxin-antitoxin module